MVAVDNFADRVRALVAEKQRSQHLDLVIGVRQETARQMRAPCAQQPPCIPMQVAERIAQPEVPQNLCDGGPQSRLCRVVAPVGRRVGVHVLGGNGRAHEQEIVVIIAAMQDAAAYRVEKGLRQLRLFVIGKQSDVMQLYLLPDRVRKPIGVEAALQVLHRFGHAALVKLDALARDALDLRPSSRLEQGSCVAAGFGGTTGSDG